MNNDDIKRDGDVKEESKQISETDSPFDFERHRSLFKGSPSRVDRYVKTDADFLKWKYERDLYYIRKKYAGPTSPKLIEKEIEDLGKLIDKLRKHLSRESYQEIPEDPKQQTALQKLIVNAPSTVPDKPWLANWVMDPKTGMYWNAQSGTPVTPPELDKDFSDYFRAIDTEYKAHIWDYKHGWLYNIFVGLIKQIFNPGGG